jgi:hypothetical protein
MTCTTEMSPLPTPYSSLNPNQHANYALILYVEVCKMMAKIDHRALTTRV